MEKAEKEVAVSDEQSSTVNYSVPKSDNNLHRNYEDFIFKWLPFHANLKQLSPKTYDEYLSSLKNHSIPYFGKRIMSSITSRDIDGFIDYLTNKPCKGAKSYNKSLNEMPRLSSASIRRHYTIFIAGLSTAKKWGYINEILQTVAPTEK